MKAIRMHQFGTTEEVLQYEEVSAPEPSPEELLIQIEAAALNRADLSLRRGGYRVKPEDLPLIPGREFSGIVTAVGPKLRAFRTGQRVVAQPGRGGYAEYAIANPIHTREVPEGLDPVVASAIPTIFLTAWFALVEEGKMKRGNQVLIQAGGSGVGIAAVQIAKREGARVITTTGSDEKCQRLRDLGADEAINYSTQDFVTEVMRLTGGKGVDLVLEMVGGNIYQKSLETLAPGGRLVSLGGAAGPIPESPPTLKENRKASRFSITSYLSAHPEGYGQLENFLSQAREGKLQVVIDLTFPLAEARAAQKYLEGRQHFGKVVLTMQGKNA